MTTKTSKSEATIRYTLHEMEVEVTVKHDPVGPSWMTERRVKSPKGKSWTTVEVLHGFSKYSEAMLAISAAIPE